MVVELALYLAYEAQLNDRDVWRLIENVSLEQFHQLSIKELCQLEWASMELKPKITSARYNTLMTSKAIESIEKATQEELMYIMQGFRKRKNKDIYERVRMTLIERKKTLFPYSSVAV